MIKILLMKHGTNIENVNIATTEAPQPKQSGTTG